MQIEIRPSVVLIGGTPRPQSSTEVALQHVEACLEKRGLATRLFGGSFLAALPHYDPARTTRSALEQDFIAALRDCAAVVVASPAYHGSVSGPVKNALDWVEDLARDNPAYLSGRAFGTIVIAYGWQAGGTTLVALRSIAHALRAWPTPFGVTINSLVQQLSEEGGDSAVLGQLDMLAEQVAQFTAMNGASRATPLPLEETGAGPCHLQQRRLACSTTSTAHPR